MSLILGCNRGESDRVRVGSARDQELGKLGPGPGGVPAGCSVVVVDGERHIAALHHVLAVPRCEEVHGAEAVRREAERLASLRLAHDQPTPALRHHRRPPCLALVPVLLRHDVPHKGVVHRLFVLSERHAEPVRVRLLRSPVPLEPRQRAGHLHLEADARGRRQLRRVVALVVEHHLAGRSDAVGRATRDLRPRPPRPQRVPHLHLDHADRRARAFAPDVRVLALEVAAQDSEGDVLGPQPIQPSLFPLAAVRDVAPVVQPGHDVADDRLGPRKELAEPSLRRVHLLGCAVPLER
eukprot:25389-Rhodomonas_salina.1